MKRLALLLLVGLAVTVEGGALSQIKEAGSLRFYVDPDNLPFSSQDLQHVGFEVELAREIARELGLRADFVWMPTRRGRVALHQLKDAVDRVLLQPGQRNAVAEILQRYGVPISSQAAGDQPAKAGTKVGENLYARSCKECHGSDAKGGGLAADLTAFKDTDDAFVRVVLNGRPGTPMLSFKGLLTEEEIRQIRAYISTLPK
jgi:mono/diheme cytochrome c family protein